MFKNRCIGLAALLALGGGLQSASAQPVAGFVPQQLPPPASGLSDHLSVQLGAQVGGMSVTRSVITPTATDYVFSLRGVLDPLGRYRADAAATLNPAGRVSLSAFATASTLERNRFYGIGNASVAPYPSSFYRLDQSLFETGLSATVGLGSPRNAISFGPFYRLLKTDREIPDGSPEEADGELVDDGGVMNLLRPYGAGSFKQLGLRSDLRLATEGPESGRKLGVRFYGGASVSPALLSMQTPVLSMYSDVKAFMRLNAPADPVLYVRGAAQRVFGDVPFHAAAYLGGSRSLRGYASQRFAGDVALLASSELYGTFGQFRVGGRPIGVGGMLLADVGRVFNDGISAGGAHMAVGGGMWLKDHRTGRQATVGLAKGAGGPRLYFAFGEPFWR